MASTDAAGETAGRRIAAIANNPTVRGVLFQIIFLAAVIWGAWEIVDNTTTNLRRQNITAGYGFLNGTAGFGIIQSFVDYAESSSYWRALLVGLINTLVVAALGIIIATILGFVVGVARLSSNWLISRIATVYVEIIRNIPLLLQLFFWYFAVLRAVPGMREKWSLFGIFHINIGGLHVPRVTFGPGIEWMLVALLVAIAISVFVSSWGKTRLEETGHRPPVGWIALALVIGLPLITFFFAGRPVGLDLPVFNETGPLLRRGFQAGAGLTIYPEFAGLLLALSIYTATYIAEIVRSGILAVSQGQTEAARSLGLRQGQTLRYVVIPQAMRVVIPPLSNQYLNLTKNSSLAVAIGYPDFVSIGGTVLNQTGHAVEIVSIWMFVYLGLSLITSFLMNLWNARMALVER